MYESVEFNTKDFSLLQSMYKKEVVKRQEEIEAIECFLDNGLDKSIDDIPKYLEMLKDDLKFDKMNSKADTSNFKIEDFKSISKFSYEARSLVCYVSEVKNIINNLKNSIFNRQANELDRIGREYLSNNYENRFSVSIRTIYFAILGKKELFNELKKFLFQKNEYYKEITKCLFFNRMSDK